MIFTPFAFMAEQTGGTPTDIPGLVAWYDPSDYVAGTTTWADRSTNGLDLTLSSTTSKSGNYVVMNGITGISPSTSLLSDTTDLTILQMAYAGLNTLGDATWSIGEGKVSSRVNEWKQDNGASATNWAVMSLWSGNGNQGLVATDNISLPANFQPGGAQSRLPYTWPYPVLTNQRPPVSSPVTNWMLSYRFGSGFTPGNTEFGKIDNGENACWNPGDGTCYPVDSMLGTSINDNINTDITNPAGSNTNYDLGSSSTIRVNGIDSTTGIYGGNPPISRFFGPTIVYNRKITDSELTKIVGYYRPTYDFRT